MLSWSAVRREQGGKAAEETHNDRVQRGSNHQN
jgi:hypothetical protein